MIMHIALCEKTKGLINGEKMRPYPLYQRYVPVILHIANKCYKIDKLQLKFRCYRNSIIQTGASPAEMRSPGPLGTVYSAFLSCVLH